MLDLVSSSLYSCEKIKLTFCFFDNFIGQVNRDLISNEMQKMRQQLKFLQAELCGRAGRTPSNEVQVCAFDKPSLFLQHLCLRFLDQAGDTNAFFFC